MNISSLQTDYVNIYGRSGFNRDGERAHNVQTECTFCGRVNYSAEQCFKRIRKEKEKARAVDVSSNSQMERPPRKCYKCGSEDHMIAKCSKQVCFIEKGNRACDIGKNNSDCKIYTSMAQMSSNNECKHCGETKN